jgi:hypothetical protein
MEEEEEKKKKENKEEKKKRESLWLIFTEMKRSCNLISRRSIHILILRHCAQGSSNADIYLSIRFTSEHLASCSKRVIAGNVTCWRTPSLLWLLACNPADTFKVWNFSKHLLNIRFVPQRQQTAWHYTDRALNSVQENFHCLFWKP